MSIPPPRRCRVGDILTAPTIGQRVVVHGWLRTRRTSKNFAFLVINDGSAQDNLQVVVDNNIAGSEHLQEYSTGAAVCVEGEVKASSGQQQVELLASALTLIGAAPDYPLQKKGHTLEFLREQAHLRARSNTFGAVFRLKHSAARAAHAFFDQEGFYWLHAPIITPSDCEGAGNLFTISTDDVSEREATPQFFEERENDKRYFFGKPAYLAVSGQLYAEAAALALGRVYTFGPTFRAENSNTTRHLAEFWMIEPEMAFADLDSICTLAVDFVRFVTAAVLQHNRAELEFLQKHYPALSLPALEKLSQDACQRITYTEAVSLLQKAERTGQRFDFSPTWGADLQTEHEKYLTAEVFSGAVIVTDYPQAIKPFYMRVNDDNKTVAAMDLLLPGIGELIGGSQREERLDLLTARCAEMHEDLGWYLDLRRFGSAPHAGWGLGFERLLQYLSGMQNIRDTVFAPRAPQLLSF